MASPPWAVRWSWRYKLLAENLRHSLSRGLKVCCNQNVILTSIFRKLLWLSLPNLRFKPVKKKLSLPLFSLSLSLSLSLSSLSLPLSLSLSSLSLPFSVSPTAITAGHAVPRQCKPDAAGRNITANDLALWSNTPHDCCGSCLTTSSSVLIVPHHQQTNFTSVFWTGLIALTFSKLYSSKRPWQLKEKVGNLESRLLVLRGIKTKLNRLFCNRKPSRPRLNRTPPRQTGKWYQHPVFYNFPLQAEGKFMAALPYWSSVAH